MGILRAALLQARLALASRISRLSTLEHEELDLINSLTQRYNCDFRLDRKHDVLLFFIEFMNVRLGANLALDVVERIVLLRGLVHYRVDHDPLQAEHGNRHSDQNIE